MYFQLTEEQEMIRQAARVFAHTELKPGVIERDEHQKFPTEQVKMLGELGFLGMMVSPEYGGSGLDAISYVLVMEELSKIDASASVVVSVNNSLVCYGLEKYGNEAQKQKYLVPLAKGEKIGAGKKSYAVSFVFQHPDKTLTDQEIEKVMSRLMSKYENELGAVIRKS